MIRGDWGDEMTGRRDDWGDEMTGRRGAKETG